MALEVASRDEVQRVRADWSRARRRRLRGNVAAAESDALTAQLESAIGALAQVLCEGFPAPRINAIGSLVDLAEHVVEAAESIDPGTGRRCEAEGGDPADCELIDGSQYSELGEAEHALEEARSAASISTLQAECAPEDTDLDPPATGARR